MYKNFTNIIFILSSLFFLPGVAHAASVHISTNAPELHPGEVTTIRVFVNTDGVAVNNTESTISFPPDILEVVSLSKAESIFSMWAEEPIFSNNIGSISFVGGVPTPGYSGSRGLILTAVVRAKKVGSANISLSETFVRANDGLGTNVFSGGFGVTLNVVPAEKVAITNLNITSQTHPNQNSWYSNASPLFAWKLPDGTTAVQTILDDDPRAVPRVTYSPAIDTKEITDLPDGVWYFKVRAKVNGSWSEPDSYTIKIDTTEPKIESSSFAYDATTSHVDIALNATDTTSGIGRYEIFVGDVLIKTLTPEEFGGSINMPLVGEGTTTLRVAVVDKALNRSEVNSTLYLTKKVKTEARLIISVGKWSAPLLNVLAVVLFILAILFGLAYRLIFSRSQIMTPKIIGTESLKLLRERIVAHLEFLHMTRRERMLSKTEKKIKKDLEDDLDDIDSILSGRNIKINKTSRVDRSSKNEQIVTK